MAGVCAIPGCPDYAVKHGRCRPHMRAREQHQRRTVPTKATRNWGERERRAEAVRQHRALYGDWCPGWGDRPGHHDTDLTADHDKAIARGGRPDGPLVVRCRSCNSAKGART